MFFTRLFSFLRYVNDCLSALVHEADFDRCPKVFNTDFVNSVSLLNDVDSVWSVF
jgi:hypothetical protein